MGNNFTASAMHGDMRQASRAPCNLHHAVFMQCSCCAHAVLMPCSCCARAVVHAVIMLWLTLCACKWGGKPHRWWNLRMTRSK